MICPRCGNMLPDYSVACNKCGLFFSNNNQNINDMPNANMNQQGMYNNMNRNIPQQTQQMPYNNPAMNNPPRKKANTRWITWFLVGAGAILVILFFSTIALSLILPSNSSTNTQSSSSTRTSKTEKKSSKSEKDDYVSATVTDTVIYEGHGVTIEIKSIEGRTVNFLIENNSTKNYSTSMHAYAINGFMADNNMYDMYQSVSSKSKANISLEIPKQLPSGYKVEEIKRMDFLIWFYDDAEEMKDFDTGVITVETNLADGTLDNDIGEEELLTSDGVTYKLVEKNDDMIIVGINNKSDQYIEFTGNNVVVNGYSLDTMLNLDLFEKLVFPDCCYPMFVEFNWDSDINFKRRNNIDKVERVKMNFDIRKNGDFDLESSTSNIIVEY